MGKGGLQILYKRVLIFSAIFLIIIGVYFFELRWIVKKTENLEPKYQQTLALSLKATQLVAKKRSLEEFEKNLQSLLGLSLKDSTEVLNKNLPFLNKEKIKEVLEKDWKIEWTQESLGKAPEVKLTLAPEDLGEFLKFLEEKKILTEITEFKIEKVEKDLKLILKFAH